MISMQSEGNANHFVRIGINFGITVLCVIPTWIVLSELDRTHEIKEMDKGFVGEPEGNSQDYVQK